VPAPRAPRVVALATLACSLAALGMGCLGAPRSSTIAPRDLEGPSASALREACTPSGIERCFDAVDDNCDGAIDEGCGLMTGLLQFVVAWPVASADVTLEVTDPTGERATTQGVTAAGLRKERECPEDDGCLGQNVENVYLDGDSPARGRYRVVVRLVSPGDAVAPIPVQLGVRIGSESHALRFELSPGDASSQRALEFTL
jgi:hypothetical protein